MRVLFVDADSVIPNLALMKLARYHYERGDEIELLRLNIPYFPNRRKRKVKIPATHDKTYCSVVFLDSMPWIETEGDVEFGGSGYSLDKDLPDEIENLKPYYQLYPNPDRAYGFISRGCIRNCYFCIVRQKEGYIRQVGDIKTIASDFHRVVLFDNNFLALPNHKEVLQEMTAMNNSFEFNQGLDIRLLDEESARLLGKLTWITHPTFAFDDWKYLPIIEEKLPLCFLIKKTPFRIRFYVYVHPKMPLCETVWRLEWLREHNCLAYFMRDVSCWSSKYSPFYIDLAAWCNSGRMFAAMDFFTFLKDRHKRDKSGARIKFSTTLYNAAKEGEK